MVLTFDCECVDELLNCGSSWAALETIRKEKSRKTDGENELVSFYINVSIGNLITFLIIQRYPGTVYIL